MRTAARLMIAMLLAASAMHVRATAVTGSGNRASGYSADHGVQPVTRSALVKTLDEQFRTADKNGDGLLTKAELGAAEAKKIKQQMASARATLAAQFSRLDINRDEQLSKAEFMLAAPEPPKVAPDVSEDFAEFDRNKDGKVTFAEYESLMLERFDSLDRQHVGKLAQPGGQTLTRGDFMTTIRSTFNRIDRGRNGRFTKAELQAFKLRLQQDGVAAARARLEFEFAKLDSNRNGRLSRTEFMAAASAPANLPDAGRLFAQFDKNRDGRISLQEFLAPFLADFDAIHGAHDGGLSPAGP